MKIGDKYKLSSVGKIGQKENWLKNKVRIVHIYKSIDLVMVKPRSRNEGFPFVFEYEECGFKTADFKKYYEREK